jgi:uncharacterized protein (DUF433 family)
MRAARSEGGERPADWYKPYIARTPGVQGGAPVLKGTRTPVRSVVSLFFRTSPDNLSEVQVALPHLSRTQIEAALAFYRAHQAEVDADLERQQRALAAFIAGR